MTTSAATAALDPYNRVLAYCLILNHNRHLEHKVIKQQNVAKLNAAVKKLPPYLAARAAVKDEN